MKRYFAVALCLLLGSCASTDIRQYQAMQPKLDLVNFFEGKARPGVCFKTRWQRCEALSRRFDWNYAWGRVEAR